MTHSGQSQVHMRLPAQLYRQYDADPSRDFPAEAYGGWHTVDVDLEAERTALVVMHAWDCGAPGEYPGWRRAVEYQPRAENILSNVFPRLLRAVRRSPLRLYHIVGGNRDYYSHLPGYGRAFTLAGPAQRPPRVTVDDSHQTLQELRSRLGSPGTHNHADIAAGLGRLDFAPQAHPAGDEGVARDADQLGALCRADGVNHLVYVGFAINWCLLMSPGGMIDMSRRGCICSTIAEAVTAVENRETARMELEKQQALWRVALEFGFVFHLEDFIAALPLESRRP